MNRKLLYLCLGFGLLLVVGAGFGSGWPRTSREPSTSETAADKVSPQALLVCYGQVDSQHGPLALLPSRAGRVTHVLAKENQVVARDTLLMKIDNYQARSHAEEAALAVNAAQFQVAKAEDGVKQYQAKFAQMEAALDAARHKILTAQAYLAVKERLHKDGFLSDEEIEVCRQQLEEARALEKVERHKLVELEAVNLTLEVKLAQVQLDRGLLLQKRARQDLDEHELKAPLAGTLVRVQVQEGDLVSPVSGKPAFLLVPAGSLIVRAEVSQEFAERVRRYQPVQVEHEPTGKVIGTGHIAEVSEWFLPRRQFIPEPTGINTGLSLECTIALDDGHASLRLGQRVRVRVLTTK